MPIARPAAALALALAVVGVASGGSIESSRHLLYVAAPGIRNYTEYGGIGILVFDIDRSHRFVKRVPLPQVAPHGTPENIKGIAANARSGRLYVTTIKRLLAIDLATDRVVWNREYEGGCDRMAIAPDGSVLFVPSFEGTFWRVVDGSSGDVLRRIETGSGAHNTIIGPDGSKAYLAGLESPFLTVEDIRTREPAVRVGPFSAPIRPFTIDGRQRLCFVNVNGLLGFEIGDLRSGKVLHRVEVTGFRPGPVKRHGCPSHGIGLLPNESELWLADGANERIHVFDATTMPPRQVTSIPLRDQPGWITFSLDGHYAYPSTGDVIDTASRTIVATLTDEHGRAVQSEKMVEVVFAGGRTTGAGDQFGVGRRR